MYDYVFCFFFFFLKASSSQTVSMCAKSPDIEAINMTHCANL